MTFRAEVHPPEPVRALEGARRPETGARRIGAAMAELRGRGPAADRVPPAGGTTRGGSVTAVTGPVHPGSAPAPDHPVGVMSPLVPDVTRVIRATRSVPDASTPS